MTDAKKTITHGQIAQALGVSVARITILKKEGMPTDSIQAALDWRQAREDERRRLAPVVVETLDDGSIAERIRIHRIKVNMAGEVWEQSIRERDPNQGKYQSSYNASLKTLLNLEEEQERRAILAKDFIKSTEAREAMLQIVSDVLTRLDKLALDTAEGCNPENPAKSVKVLEAWVRKTRSEISSI
jgi:DNA-binding transcriptional MerR regulator